MENPGSTARAISHRHAPRIKRLANNAIYRGGHKSARKMYRSMNDPNIHTTRFMTKSAKSQSLNAAPRAAKTHFHETVEHLNKPHTNGIEAHRSVYGG